MKLQEASATITNFNKAKVCLKAYFIVCLIIPLIVIFNLSVDSLGLFTSRLNKPAKALAEGKIVSILGNVDERKFRKLIIENLKKESEYVVIGSSRIMRLKQRILDVASFFNYGMSGASLEDYLAILEIHFEHFGHFPHNIIFGIDPFIFNKNNNQKRFTSIQKEYQKMLKKIGFANVKIEYEESNLPKLFSLDYAKENWKFLQKGIFKGFEILSNTDENRNFYEPDGSYQYNYKKRYPDPNNTIIIVKKSKPYSMNGFKQLDNVAVFEALIRYLQSNNSHIYFYLPPYHPYTYENMIVDPKYKIILDIESYLKKFAKEHNIPVLGSYNPQKYSFTNNDFFDGIHSSEKVYDVIFKKEFRKQLSLDSLK